MKNFLIALPILFLGTMACPSFAQTFGLKAGINFANMLYKTDNNTYSNSFKSAPGFLVGATVAYPINDWLAVESGLQLSQKGYRFEYFDNDNNSGHTGRTSLYYIELPVLAKGTYNLGKVGIYGMFGPYFGLGVAGKSVDNITPDTGPNQGVVKKEKSTIEWGKIDNGDHVLDLGFKRGDFGVIIGAGISVQQIQIGLSYNAGLSNIATEPLSNPVKKHRVFGIMLGYMLGDKN